MRAKPTSSRLARHRHSGTHTSSSRRVVRVRSAVLRCFGVDCHLAHDCLAQDAVALPAVARMRLAAMQPHALDEGGFEIEQVLQRREAGAGREGVALRGRGIRLRFRRFR